MVTIARRIAAARAGFEAKDAPPDSIDQLWSAGHGFETAVRKDQGLHQMPAHRMRTTVARSDTWVTCPF
ncbi:hypothetical protein [Nocardia abscessus]|uniref:hypothetical protein n=1 Tax=Nocardia abscessus TaxID=120957 RepID=UPI0002E5CCB4|nr:hypothetical protein [Nocardia abscessus]MCC3328175.1 hypothetical protein [Nocardia abscessus]